MRKVILITFIVILFNSCGSMFTVTNYDVGLKNVESPKNAKEQFGETKIVNIEEEGHSKYRYEDDLISINWYVSLKQFHFDLKNKSNFSFKIPWDDIAYVNSDGQVQRVMHSGVKYIDRNSSQPASTLPKGAVLSDILIPTDNIYYVSGQYGGWRETNLFPNFKTQIEADNSGLIGETVRIVFPIIIENVTNEYVFEFNIIGLTVKQ